MKSLVDLAMASVEGQGDIEVQIVNCLETAATGYGALIFGFTGQTNIDELLLLFKDVLKHYECNKSLPDKLVMLFTPLHIFLHIKV